MTAFEEGREHETTGAPYGNNDCPYPANSGDAAISNNRTAWWNGFISGRINRKFAKTFEKFGVALND